MYKWSRYNFFISENSDSNLLYNSRTGHLIRVSRDRSEQIAKDEILDEDLFSTLYRLDFIVNEMVDEVALIKEENYRARNDRSTLTITVELTEACNFRCSYCYQAHKKQHISGNVEQGIINLIQERCGDELKVVQLNWFGGEPLLRLDDIKRISSAVS